MKTINKQPKIRFKGYTDEWEQRKLNEFMDFSNGINAPKENYGKGRKMISVMDILSPNKITYQNIRNSVSVSEAIESKNKVENGDLIFVRSSEIVQEVGLSKAYTDSEYALYSGFSIRGKRKAEYNPLFMEINLNNGAGRKQIERKAGGSTRFNVSQEILNSIDVLMPIYEEQNKIADVFENINNTIALHQSKLEALEKTKKSFLQKMFPKKDDTKPEIRFAGFTDDWEQRKFFDNISSTIDFRGRTPKKLGMNWSTSGYLALSALNVKNGYIDPLADAHYGDEELYNKWMAGKELKKGHVLFTTEAPMGNVAQVPDDKGYILSQRTIAFEAKEKMMTNDFLAILLKSPIVFNSLSALSSGGTAKGVSQRSLKALSVVVPNSIKEQQKIGTFFKQLDDTIALHQRQLEVLKNMKTSFLQKMYI